MARPVNCTRCKGPGANRKLKLHMSCRLGLKADRAAKNARRRKSTR